MIKILKNRKILLCGLLPELVADEVTLEEYKKLRGLYIEDPWERVKCIFSKDDHGDIHPEIKYAKQMFAIGLGVGGFFGGAVNSYIKTETFIRQNEANTFSASRQAIKAFANHNMLTFLKGGFKWAPLFGIFFSGFSLVASCCEAYRGRPHITDSTAAGAVVGGLSRLMLGIKGMISGAVVGGALGTIYGTVVWGLSKISNTDQTELKYSQFAFSQYRKQLNDRSRTQKQGEDEILEKFGLHSAHVVNPLNELDSNKKEAETYIPREDEELQSTTFV